MHLPLELRRAVKALYNQVELRFVLNGRMSAERVAVKGGIKQGCPYSGSLWALLYDPVVRALSQVLPPRELSVCSFADDLAAASFRAQQALLHLLECFGMVRKATRLRVNVRKAALVYYGAHGHAEVLEEIAAAAGGERMVVSGSGVYLGVPIAPSSRAGFGDRVTAKVRRATRHISGLHITVADRIRAYRVFGQSVAGYLAQVRRPDSALVRADRAAVAKVMAVPMHSMGPGVLPHIASLGGRAGTPEITTLAEAAAIRCAARHPRLGMLFDRIRAAAESDDALLVPRHGGWRRDNCLSHMRAALSQVNGLPGRVRNASDLQKVVQRHLERSRAVDDLHGWMRRRGRAIWGYDPPHGHLRVFFARVRALFRTFPDFVALATLRIAGDAWLTTRRMSRHPGWCVFGCQAAGGDCLRHYIGCPNIARARYGARALSFRVGCTLATSVLPLSRCLCLVRRSSA